MAGKKTLMSFQVKLPSAPAAPPREEVGGSRFGGCKLFFFFLAVSSGQPSPRACPSLFTFLPFLLSRLLFPHSSSPFFLPSVVLTHSHGKLLLELVPGAAGGKGSGGGGRSIARPPFSRSPSRRVSQGRRNSEEPESSSLAAAAAPPFFGAKVSGTGSSATGTVADRLAASVPPTG